MGFKPIQIAEKMEQLTFSFGSDRNPIRIDLKEYKGRPLLDIRKYFKDSNNPEILIPTKKGISLNGMQLSQMIDVLNSNKESINQFFENRGGEVIELSIQNTIGRIFEMIFENGKTSFVFDKTVAQRFNEDETNLIAQMMNCYIQSLTDVIEDDDEVGLILDSLNARLKKAL